MNLISAVALLNNAKHVSLLLDLRIGIHGTREIESCNGSG